MIPDLSAQICHVLHKILPDLSHCYHKTSQGKYISTAFYSKTYHLHIVVESNPSSTEVSITSGEFNPNLPAVQTKKAKALKILKDLKTLFPNSESETWWDDGTAHRFLRIPHTAYER